MKDTCIDTVLHYIGVSTAKLLYLQFINTGDVAALH